MPVSERHPLHTHRCVHCKRDFPCNHAHEPAGVSPLLYCCLCDPYTFDPERDAPGQEPAQ